MNAAKRNTMHDTNAGEPHGLWPSDADARAASVLAFVVGHPVLQEQLDETPERDHATWIALIGTDLGAACRVVSAARDDADAERAAAGWLACASADALRARFAFAPADRAELLDDLHAHLISVQLSEPAWKPAIQVAFVTTALGQLAETATPIMTADPTAHGPVPRFDQVVAAILRLLHPDLPAERRAEPVTNEPALDPIEAASWALEDIAHTAAGAAVLLHPGGPVGIPPAPTEPHV
jgi:hypothetical protein